MIEVPILRRLLSSSSARAIGLTISPEIQQGLKENKPIVSLESTIITHGLPFPQNIEMAFEAENVIRKHGALPATCGFIAGKPLVGMTRDETMYLGEQTSVNKVSRRDIGYTMANRLNGGTTIAATMILSHLAGIKVFATGGLGGVHRDGENTMDVSADLTELGRTPVTVVCSGPKSILDIGRTMEYLETQGVFVATYDEENRSKVDVPGFFCRQSGILSPYIFRDYKEAARIINSSNMMNLSSGNLLCIPPPQGSALSSEEINETIEAASVEATTKGVKGKDITPFLLDRIAKKTEGRSVSCNIDFVLNNAKCAALISKELSQLSLEANSSNKNTNFIDGHKGVSFQPVKPTNINACFVGATALDSMSKIKQETVMRDSNPAVTTSSVGGVAHNIYLASVFSGLSESKLVSIVGDDLPGKAILQSLKDRNEDSTGILVDGENSTATYTSTHDKEGGLVVACADMSIVETDYSNHIIKTVVEAKPKLVMLDCNLSSSAMKKVVSELKRMVGSVDLVVDPTSSTKSKKLAKLRHKVFPNHLVSLLCPTKAEISAIHDEFQVEGLFDNDDEWFTLLDTFGINSAFRDRMSSHKVLNSLLKDGYLQQSFKLIPYFPNIILKLGDKGALSISLSNSVDDYKSIPTVSPNAPEIILCSSGRMDGNNRTGIVLQYYPIPEENQGLLIKNVTGAGDSFLGYIIASLSKSNWLGTSVSSIENEWLKWESISKAQIASGLSLQSEEAVSENIRSIGQ